MGFDLSRPSYRAWRSRVVLGRRQVLLASLGAPLICSLPAHGADGGLSRFLTVSRRLTGYDDLDAQLGERLYRGLGAVVTNLDTELETLAAADEAALGQSVVSKAILTGWYLGVIGSGAHTTCIAYVSTLQVRVVADVLRPPSYAYGPYGSWQSPPRAA